MTLEIEDEAIGQESHLVQPVDPGEKCNAKKTVTIHGQSWEDDTDIVDEEILEEIKEKNDIDSFRGTQENRTFFRGFCRNGAGKGTNNDGGRCHLHGGQSTGAPTHNQNAAKTGTTSDPHHYHENLPKEEQQWIQDTTASILDRIRRIHGRDPDFLDRSLARSVAINFHILSNARDKSKDDLVQVIVHDGGSHEEKGALVEEIRRFQNSIIQNLKQLGVLEDPESKKADAMGEWKNFIESGSTDQNVIDVESSTDDSSQGSDGSD